MLRYALPTPRLVASPIIDKNIVIQTMMVVMMTDDVRIVHENNYTVATIRLAMI